MQKAFSLCAEKAKVCTWAVYPSKIGRQPSDLWVTLVTAGFPHKEDVTNGRRYHHSRVAIDLYTFLSADQHLQAPPQHTCRLCIPHSQLHQQAHECNCNSAKE
jgi:hypothetical protein